MKDNLISIIVPVYNVEKYLSRCLDSIINQTYTNLEIILVDDGSSDNSGKICDEYEKKDKRIIVIHKKNSGVSSARNLGIKKANGKFIGFVDSDDYIDKNMYKVLYDNIIKYDANISMCNYYIVNKQNTTYHKHNIKENTLLIDNKKEFFCLLNQNYYKGFLWNKLFYLEDIKKYLLNENLHYCEDLLLVCQIAQNVKKFCFDNTCLYYYNIRSNSAVNNIFNLKKVTVLEAYKNILNIVKKVACEEYDKYLQKYFLYLNDFIHMSKDIKLKYCKELKQIYKVLIKSKKLTLKEKCILSFRYKFYAFFNTSRRLKKFI